MEIVVIFLKVLMIDVCIKNIVTNEKNSIISATFFEVADIFSQMDISICVGYMKLGIPNFIVSHFMLLAVCDRRSILLHTPFGPALLQVGSCKRRVSDFFYY